VLTARGTPRPRKTTPVARQLDAVSGVPPRQERDEEERDLWIQDVGEQPGDDEQREVLGSEHRGLMDAGASVSGMGR
jgi:hypothetical protein